MPWSVILLVKRRKSHGLFDWEKKISLGCGLGCRDVDWDHPKIELKIEEWKVKTRKTTARLQGKVRHFKMGISGLKTVDNCSSYFPFQSQNPIKIPLSLIKPPFRMASFPFANWFFLGFFPPLQIYPDLLCAGITARGALRLPARFLSLPTWLIGFMVQELLRFMRLP